MEKQRGIKITNVDETKQCDIHVVTHRYSNINEAKPKNESTCIVNNGGNNYHIAFWDEEANGFVNNTGYLKQEFNKWIYLPINGG